MNKTLKYKMYQLVIYNLSGIQKGIQGGHAGDQYQLEHPDSEEYKEWVLNHKTVIVLDGGTTNDGLVSCYGEEPYIGTMQEHRNALELNKIDYSIFKEPDLNNAMTAIALIADERVYNHDDYPRFSAFCELYLDRDVYLKTFRNGPYNIYDVRNAFPELNNEWVKLIGGPKNAFLKEWLPLFKLASN